MKDRLLHFWGAATIAVAIGLASAGPANAAESIAKQCGADWQAAKKAGTTNGQSWADFYKACAAQKQAGAVPAAATAPVAAAASPTPTIAKPAPTPAVAKPAPVKMPVVATGAGQFANEAEAKSHCPSDAVVWVNTATKKYHYSGNKRYGSTKEGAYMCEADAKTAGDVAAKGEKPK